MSIEEPTADNNIPSLREGDLVNLVSDDRQSRLLNRPVQMHGDFPVVSIAPRVQVYVSDLEGWTIESVRRVETEYEKAIAVASIVLAGSLHGLSVLATNEGRTTVARDLATKVVDALLAEGWNKS